MQLDNFRIENMSQARLMFHLRRHIAEIRNQDWHVYVIFNIKMKESEIRVTKNGKNHTVQMYFFFQKNCETGR